MNYPNEQDVLQSPTIGSKLKTFIDRPYLHQHAKLSFVKPRSPLQMQIRDPGDDSITPRPGNIENIAPSLIDEQLSSYEHRGASSVASTYSNSVQLKQVPL